MNLLEHRRFRAAYDFMMLLVRSGPEGRPGHGEVLDRRADSPPDERAASFQIAGCRVESGKRRAARKRPRKTGAMNS